ncbi:MAG: hypothetical protein Q8P50_13230 [Bacillota bacterium]|nr:hypothetical protein [Bacillota bacterium]
MSTSSLAASTRNFFLTLALLAGACESSANLIGPENQLEVNNTTDTFQWQVSALSGVTQTLTYTWVNNGTIANVNQSSSPSSGSADLRILDAGGAQVYSRGLEGNGTFQTGAGTAGRWTVTVTLIKVNGTLNFRLQKP